MSAKRTTMRTIKEVLRLKYEAKLSLRKIVSSLKIGLGTVSLHLERAKKANLSWPLLHDIDDQTLALILFPNFTHSMRSGYLEPDCLTMHNELKQKGMTKQLLWEEYKQINGDQSYQYSQYCQRYRDWVKTLKRSMRQVHTGVKNCLLITVAPPLQS